MERRTSKLSLYSTASITTPGRTLAELFATPETEDHPPHRADISCPVPESPSPNCSSSSDQISPRISDGFWSQLIPNSISGSESEKFPKLIERLHRMRIKNNDRIDQKQNPFIDFNEENPRLESTGNCAGYFELEPGFINYFNPENRRIGSPEIESEQRGETYSEPVPRLLNASSDSTDDANTVIIHEGEIDQWQNAKQTKFMDRLKRKEESISEWESKKTKIAMDNIKKLEMKMDMKKARKVDQMKRKMESLEKRAEEMKAKERKSIMKKVSRINKISNRSRSNKSRVLTKIMKLF